MRRVANAGISANDVTADRCPGCGVSAEAHLQRDVLSQPGVSTVIFLEGINDIGTGAVTSAGQLIAADKQIIARSHADGLRIPRRYPPPPRSGFQSAAGADPRSRRPMDTDRRAFDAVIDFDKATRDPADPQPTYRRRTPVIIYILTTLATRQWPTLSASPPCEARGEARLGGQYSRVEVVRFGPAFRRDL